MELADSLRSILMIFAALAGVSLIELAIPLHRRNAWSRAHLVPNLALALIVLGLNALLNLPLLVALEGAATFGFGLLNLLDLPLWADLLLGVLVFDLAWYVNHRTMHRFAWMWRFHRVHHSDPMVDVTTTLRQHPSETLIRFVFLLGFGLAAGASPAAFALSRGLAVMGGYIGHANVALPRRLDLLISTVLVSPDMHKVHHSRDQAFTDRNYSNIFSLWDRLFGTFVPTRHGRTIEYGLDRADQPELQGLVPLLQLRQPAA